MNSYDWQNFSSLTEGDYSDIIRLLRAVREKIDSSISSELNRACSGWVSATSQLYDEKLRQIVDQATHLTHECDSLEHLIRNIGYQNPALER